MKIKQAACILFVNSDGFVLTASRRGDADDIGLPGGKVDPRETTIEAACREIKEEIGLDIDKSSLDRFFVRNCISKTDCFDTTVFIYNGKDVDDLNPTQQESGIFVRWATWGELIRDTNSFADYNRATYNRYRKLKNNP